MRTPAVSVIVPAFNAARTLTRCLESISRLDYPDYEVILVDDGSVDETAELVGGFPCTLVRLERNCGAAQARNCGAARARGDILAFTDADCVVPVNWLRVMADALLQDDVAGVTGGYSHSVGDSLFERLQFYFDEHENVSLPGCIETCTTSNFGCWKRDFYAIGGFPADAMWGSEDELLGFLLTRNDRKILWHRGMAVGHCFRPTLSTYAQQRFRCAYATLCTWFRHPQLAIADQDYDQRGNFWLFIAALIGMSGLASAVFRPWLAGFTVVPIVAGPVLDRALLWRIRREEHSIVAAALACALRQLRMAAQLMGILCGIAAGGAERICRSAPRPIALLDAAAAEPMREQTPPDHVVPAHDPR